MSTQAKPIAASSERTMRAAGELLRSASLEMSAHRPGDAAAIAAVLPAETTVTVNHLPRHSLDDTMAAIAALRRAGLTPVPHLAARRFASKAEAAGFLRRAVDEGDVSRVVVIGGEVDKPEGPFADGASLLRSEILAKAGIREITLPGYPEGHPALSGETIRAALDEKIGIASAQGHGVSMLTQFSYAPKRIVEYCAEMRRSHADLPITVGIVGPTSALKLLQYAQRCGVSASLRALQAQGLSAVKQLLHTDPSEQLSVLSRHAAAGSLDNVTGIHIYSFGGVRAAAEWINGRRRGD
jgi:methylenetetrahydrofolate reductase (NADPH)